jgi:hypothetical protein
MITLKNALQPFLSFFRRILGIEQIQQQLRQQQQQQLQQHQLTLLTLGNTLKYSSMDSETVEATTTYRRCAEIVSLLSPMDVAGGRYIRVGRDYDGGYVMLDHFQQKKVDVAYSFGIFDDISWDEAIAKQGVDVFMYDHTIDQLPKQNSKFHYFKTGVTGYKKGTDLKTLGELIVDNGHAKYQNLIMKMDIEGCEWDVLEETSSDVISQFSQIVIELHDLTQAVFTQKHLSIVNVLQKINQTHQSIHVHANGTSVPLWIGKCVLPTLLEVTYIRRADVNGQLTKNTRQFPTKIDQPTFENMPDIYLGSFSNDRGPIEY